MDKNKPKITPKGAVKRLRKLYENNLGKASSELLEIFKAPTGKEETRDKHCSTDISPTP